MEDGLPCQEGDRCVTSALSLCWRERQLTLSWRPVGSRVGASSLREAAGETRERSCSKAPEKANSVGAERARRLCRSHIRERKVCLPTSRPHRREALRRSTANGAAPRKNPSGLHKNTTLFIHSSHFLVYRLHIHSAF